MSCQIRTEEHRNHLLEYSARKLDGEAAARMREHMRECADCAEFGKSQAAVWDLLDAWEVGAVSADFDRRLYARIDAAASASWLERMIAGMSEFLRPAFARPAFPLAAATLLIVGGFVLDHPRQALSSAGNREEIRVSSLQAGSHTVVDTSNSLQVDQVESTLDDIDMLRQFDTKPDDNGKDNPSKSM